MKRANLLLLMFGCVLCLTQCKKGDQGDVGPAGPQGTTGTAKVIYSDWFAFAAAEYVDTTMVNLTLTKRAIKTASAITQPILDSGVILAYMKNDVLSYGPYALPFTYNINPARVIGYIPRVGNIIFYEYSTNGSGGVATPNNKFRYILIPGGVKTNGRMRTFESMSYDEICKSLEIPK